MKLKRRTFLGWVAALVAGPKKLNEEARPEPEDDWDDEEEWEHECDPATLDYFQEFMESTGPSFLRGPEDIWNDAHKNVDLYPRLKELEERDR